MSEGISSHISKANIITALIGASAMVICAFIASNPAGTAETRAAISAPVAQSSPSGAARSKADEKWTIQGKVVGRRNSKGLEGTEVMLVTVQNISKTLSDGAFVFSDVPATPYALVVKDKNQVSRMLIPRTQPDGTLALSGEADPGLPNASITYTISKP